MQTNPTGEACLVFEDQHDDAFDPSTLDWDRVRLSKI